MAKETIVLTGDKKLNRKLARLTGTEAKKVIRKAARPALKPVLTQARSNAPKKTGTLKKSIKIRSLKRSRSRVGAMVTTGTETSDYQTFYGAFQEFGWKTGKRESRGGSGNRRQIPGRHYMLNAANQRKDATVAIYRDKISKGIIEIATAGGK